MGWLRVDRLVDGALGVLLPPRCVLCGAAGQRNPTLDLCVECEAALPWCRPGEGAPLAVFRYAPPVDHLVQALKYQRRLALARVLGTLAARPAAVRALLAGVDAILPMPLHPARASARGFNQSLEIARWLCRALDLPLATQWLRRVRDTPPQVGLNASARRTNVAGAFVAAPAVAGRRIALLDDVLTSGASSAAAAAALCAGRCRSVHVLALARA
jgi:ComF family protein